MGEDKMNWLRNAQLLNAQPATPFSAGSTIERQAAAEFDKRRAICLFVDKQIF
jgi:hypothetical protein